MNWQAPVFHNDFVLQSGIESYQETRVKLCLETLLYSVASLKEKNTDFKKYFTFGFFGCPLFNGSGCKDSNLIFV